MKGIASIISGLLLIGTAHELLPERIAQWRGESEAAWDFVAAGAQTACLWAGHALLLFGYTRRHPLARRAALAVCTWGAAEAILRPGCRLLLPMDRRPDIPPGGDLCTAAGMPWWYSLTPLAAAMCAVAVAGLLASTTTRPTP